MRQEDSAAGASAPERWAAQVVTTDFRQDVTGAEADPIIARVKGMALVERMLGPGLDWFAMPGKPRTVAANKAGKLAGTVELFRV